MKRALILSLTSFYLLLTTGMFVCIVHCAGTRLFNHSKTHLADNHSKQPSKDKCNGNDCSCCKKHDNFVIKENIKPHYGFTALDLGPLNYVQITFSNSFQNKFTNEISWPECHGPPAKSGKSISIVFRSLQI